MVVRMFGGHVPAAELRLAILVSMADPIQTDWQIDPPV